MRIELTAASEQPPAAQRLASGWTLTLNSAGSAKAQPQPEGAAQFAQPHTVRIGIEARARAAVTLTL